MQCNTNKASIRKELKEKRKQFSKEEAEAFGKEIFKNLKNMPEYKGAKNICLYMDSFNEVRTKSIIRSAKALGKKVFVPVVDGENIYISKLTYPLVKGNFGIQEPKKKVFADANDIDLFFVPGIAFDRQGNRLGFGCGYYDKLLKDAGSIKIGLLYDFQLVADLPTDKHDIKMDYLVSEKGVINCGKEI